MSGTVPMDTMHELLPRASTGVAGLDHVLGGGLARNRLHLLEGSPGTGKTTIALQFLLAGAANGEVGIYVSLAETERELREGAGSHGWTIGNNIEIMELIPPESVLDLCSTRQILSLAKPSNAFLGVSSGFGRSVSSSTASRRSGCWHRARCATGGRFSR